MATREPLVRFYDLSGPKPWSPACWMTRYALNYKQIPYTVTNLSYPAIRPKCEELFPDMTGLEATVPIIEILQPPYKALNDSTPIVNLLNERFTEKDGFKHLKGLDTQEEYRKSLGKVSRLVFQWIVNDVYTNSLDPSDGSKEYFKKTREEFLGCECKWYLSHPTRISSQLAILNPLIILREDNDTNDVTLSKGLLTKTGR